LSLIGQSRNINIWEKGIVLNSLWTLGNKPAN